MKYASIWNLLNFCGCFKLSCLLTALFLLIFRVALTELFLSSLERTQMIFLLFCENRYSFVLLLKLSWMDYSTDRVIFQIVFNSPDP